MDSGRKRTIQPVKRLMFEQVVDAPKKKRRVLSTKGKPKSSSRKTNVDGLCVHKRAALKRIAKGKVAKPKLTKKSSTTKKEKKEKKVKEPKVAKKPRWIVRSHPSVKIINKDPFFSASSSNSIPFVSTDTHSKLIITAVLTKNKKMMQSLLTDTQKVSTVTISRSVDVSANALSYALRMHDIDMIKALFQAIQENKKRPARTQRLLAESSTGHYNIMSLGVPRIRKLQVSRGSKEGNNAFTSREETRGLSNSVLWELMEYGGTGELYETVCALMKTSGYSLQRKACNNVYVAARWGNRELSEHILKTAVEDFQWGFGQLHYRVLSAKRVEDLPKFRATSVTKKCHSNALITPLHLACINPNEAILGQLLNIYPEYSVADKQGWRPIHYAAACSSDGPLKLLLKRGVNPYEMTSMGHIALHVAAEKGREKNIEALLKHAEEVNKQPKRMQRQGSKMSQGGDVIDDEMEADLSGESKFGVGSINRPTRNSYTPLHLAIKRGHTGVVSTLIKHGKSLNIAAKLSATKEKKTGLMLAAMEGHMEIVRQLLEAGGSGVVDTVDKHRRTALTLASKNGHTHVASLLLFYGADPNHRDSSGNSVLHYAAAYGWYYMVELLLDRGADPNAASEWKSTPLSVAFLNGQAGIVRQLLKQPTVDVNFVSDAGTTLIMMACQSHLNKTLVEQIKLLVNELKARCDLVDADGNSAMHHLANNAPKTPMVLYEDQMKASVEVAEVLLSAGADPALVNEVGYNALNLALLAGNARLVDLLVQKNVVLTEPNEPMEANVMHRVGLSYCLHDLSQVYDPLVASPKNLAMMKKLVSLPDNTGARPLHHVAFSYFIKRIAGQPDKSYKFGIDFLRFFIVTLEADINVKVEDPKSAKKVKEFIKPKEKRSVYYVGKHNSWPTTRDYYTLKDGQNAAMYIALAHDDGEATKMLEETSHYHKLDPNIRFKGRTVLHDVVKSRRHEAVKCLIRMGADVNAVSEKCSRRQMHESPLMTAVKLVDVKMVEVLLEHGADVGLTDSCLGNTALHYACCAQNRTMDNEFLVRLLVEHSPRNLIRLPNDQGRTPLHLAANFNRAGTDSSADMEEFLVSKGADILARDCRDRIPLHYVFTKFSKHSNKSEMDPIELCQTLANKQSSEAVDAFGSTPLHLAAMHGAAVCAQFLLQQAQPGYINWLQGDGNSALSLSVMSKHLNCSMVLAQMKPDLKTDVHLQDESSDVAKKSKVDVWVWEGDKEPDPVVQSKRSLFESVLRNQWQGMAYILAERLPNEGVSHEDIIHDALRTQTYRLAMTLIRRWGDFGPRCGALFHSLVEFSQPEGHTESTQLRLAEMMIERKVPHNEKDGHGATPLTKALIFGNYHLARFFIEKGRIDPNTKDGLGRPPLINTFFKRPKLNTNLQNWLTFLKNKGVNFNQLGDFPVHNPLWHLRREPPRDYTVKGSGLRISPLIDCIRNHNFAMARMLLQTYKVDPNFPDSEGCSPLMHAVSVNDEKLVRLLLDHNYDGTDKKQTEASNQPRSAFTFFTGTTIQGNNDNASEEMEQDDDDEPEEADDDDDEQKEEDEQAEEDEQEEEPEEQADDDDDDMENSLSEVSSVENLVPDKTNEKINPVDPEIPEDFPMVVPCSTVDLSRVDRIKRWTVLHHVVAPTKSGTFDNARLLRLLVHAGASLAHASELLKLANDRRARVIMKTVQYLINRPKRQWERVPNAPARLLKASDIPKLPAGMTVEKDYRQLITDFEAELDDKEEVNKFVHEVDRHCPVKDSANLVTDDRLGRFFDVTLHKIGVERGPYGLYNFYTMQIIHQRTKDIYFLFTHWGRIGDSGQHQNTPFPDLESARKEFDKVFRSKTGNKWIEIANFEEKPKKYELLKLDKGDKKNKVKSLPIDLDTVLVPKVKTEVEKLMSILFNVKDLQNHKVTASRHSDLSIPFGRIRRESVEEAAGILKDIVTLSANLRSGLSAFHRSDPSNVLEKLQHDSQKLADLSNAYFKLIPQSTFAFTPIHPLLDESDVSAQLDLVTRLLEMHHIGRLVLAAQKRKTEIHPFDYIHGAIGCCIRPLQRASDEAEIILQYCSKKVEQVFVIDRPGEEKRCLSADGPRKLLWHGTNPYNIPSILQHGLLIAPPGIERCGEAFGKGIYFADSADLSFNYAGRVGKPSRKFLFLCEVDVANLAQDEENEKVKGGRFVRMGADPDASGNFVLPNGCIIPLGKRSTHWYACHNQYVIFDEERVRLRYLLQLLDE